MCVRSVLNPCWIPDRLSKRQINTERPRDSRHMSNSQPGESKTDRPLGPLVILFLIPPSMGKLLVDLFCAL